MNDFNGALNKSLDDFMESYKITDTEKIYSNGMELIPIFRVKQWFEYNNQDEEIERLDNIINEIEAIIYNTQLTGIEARLEIQERLDKLQELKDSDK